MRQLIAFTKKEFMEVSRNGRFLILLIVFALFGIMNPAIAKITPWLMEQMSGTLEESGFIVTEVTVDALTSWTQFYKNVPMGLIVFILMFSGIMASELQKGSLINMITKGMSRKAIIVAKAIVMLALWSLNYWMCFGITYIYNEYFWDNSIAEHVFFAAFLIYMLGAWLILLLVMMSGIFSTASAVTLGTGGVFFVCYLLSMLPKLKKYLPTKLMDAGTLLSGAGETGDYAVCLAIVAVLCVVQMVVGMLVFDKKRI